MKTISPSSFAAAATLLGAALFAVTTVTHAPMALAQDPPPQGPAGEHHHQPAPPPTNLKVLPKDLTGDQVHEIMHKWEADLGAECGTCHTADPVKKMPNGRPALNFADDSKKEKETARQMVKMTMEINKSYTSLVESSHDNQDSAKKVSCGTCHRGHLDPPAFVPPPEHEHEHHEGSGPESEHPAVAR